MSDSNTNNNLATQAFNFVTNWFKKPDDQKPDEQEFDATKIISTMAGLFGGAKFGSGIMSKLLWTVALGAVAYFASNWIKDHFNMNASGDAPEANAKATPKFLPAGARFAELDMGSGPS